MEGPAASRFIPPCVGNSPAANPLQIAAVPSSRRYGRPRKKATGVNPPPEGGGRLRGFQGRCHPGTPTPTWSRLPVHERRLPERDPFPGHRVVAGLRP